MRSGKIVGVCNISAELLKAEGAAMICGLHAVLTALWQPGTNPPDLKKGAGCPNLEKGRVPSGLQEQLLYYSAYCGRQGVCYMLFMENCNQLI